MNPSPRIEMHDYDGTLRLIDVFTGYCVALTLRDDEHSVIDVFVYGPGESTEPDGFPTIEVSDVDEMGCPIGNRRDIPWFDIDQVGVY